MASRDLGLRDWKNSGKQNKEKLRSPLRVGQFQQIEVALNIHVCMDIYNRELYYKTITTTINPIIVSKYYLKDYNERLFGESWQYFPLRTLLTTMHFSIYFSDIGFP